MKHDNEYPDNKFLSSGYKKAILSEDKFQMEVKEFLFLPVFRKEEFKIMLVYQADR